MHLIDYWLSFHHVYHLRPLTTSDIVIPSVNGCRLLNKHFNSACSLLYAHISKIFMDQAVL